MAPECFLFIDYDNLLKNPAHELQRVHKFLELPDHEYDFNNLDGTNLRERDEEDRDGTRCTLGRLMAADDEATSHHKRQRWTHGGIQRQRA
jgi:hypothetical protein